MAHPPPPSHRVIRRMRPPHEHNIPRELMARDPRRPATISFSSSSFFPVINIFIHSKLGIAVWPSIINRRRMLRRRSTFSFFFSGFQTRLTGQDGDAAKGAPTGPLRGNAIQRLLMMATRRFRLPYRRPSPIISRHGSSGPFYSRRSNAGH